MSQVFVFARPSASVAPIHHRGHGDRIEAWNAGVFAESAHFPVILAWGIYGLFLRIYERLVFPAGAYTAEIRTHVFVTSAC